MATLTATQALSGVSPKGNHRGLDAVTSTLVMGTDAVSLSSGDVINWGRIPNGSRIVDVIRGGGVAGLDVTAALRLGGVTLSGGASLGLAVAGSVAIAGLPAVGSVSGDATGDKDQMTQMLDTLIGTVASGSAIGNVSLTIMVTRDTV